MLCDSLDVSRFFGQSPLLYCAKHSDLSGPDLLIKVKHALAVISINSYQPNERVHTPVRHIDIGPLNCLVHL